MALLLHSEDFPLRLQWRHLAESRKIKKINIRLNNFLEGNLTSEKRGDSLSVQPCFYMIFKAFQHTRIPINTNNRGRLILTNEIFSDTVGEI